MQVTAALAVVFVFVFVLLAGPLTVSATRVVDDLGLVVAPAAASAGCCWASVRAPGPGRVRWGWRLLAAGCGLWAPGEGVWSFYELVAGRAVPFPSLADVGFLSFTVLAVAALLLLPTGLRRGARLRDLIDGLVIAGSLLVLALGDEPGRHPKGGRVEPAGSGAGAGLSAG